MKRVMPFSGVRWVLVFLGWGVLSAVGYGQEAAHLEAESEFGSYVEEGFPFFGQVLDGREQGVGIVPRGIVLKLGDGVYGCFDPDLLRLALVWRETEDGEWLEMNSMSAGSYRVPSLKAPAGQKVLPKVKGEVISWMGPDCGITGEFLGLLPFGERVALKYSVEGAEAMEMIYGDGDGGYARMIGVDPHEDSIELVLATYEGKAPKVEAFGVGGEKVVKRSGSSGEKQIVGVIPPSDQWQAYGFGINCQIEKINFEGMQEPEEVSIWRDSVRSRQSVSTSEGAFAIDELEIPIPNPWARNVRLSGMDFFSDGRLAVCTFDGDVWVVEGVSMGSEEATWQRYASGLHEPMGLRVVEDEVFVFDRAGIWRLHDENGDGEADFYEMWSNVVPQTAETREFAMGLLEKPGGGFYVAKGGQEVSTKGIANGTISEVSADGKSYEIFANGLRQPFAGIDPVTGMITSSDQQGNWVPSTPIHVIERGRHYGFVPKVLEQVRYEGLQEPAVWIPHIVNQSGAKQVWLRDAAMGPLNDTLIHIGYNRPELFRVFFDEAGKERQGAVASVVSGFPCALLDGAVNPEDGQLYVCGFRIWGTALDQISGLFRVRYTGEVDTAPEDVRSEERGIMMRFGFELDEAVATSPMSYTVERWNYRRSKDYGSGHYRLDGEPGQEALPVASVTLSEDKKSVFLGIPDMEPVDTVSVRYRVADGAELPRVQSAYLTVRQLNGIDLREAGFASDEVDLEIDPSMIAAAKAAPEPSVEQGELLATTIGCVACHSVDGSQVEAQPGLVVGPTWKDLWGTRRELSDGTVVKAVDAPYLRESILEPGAKIAAGFENMGVGMPSYLGILQDWQVESLVLYIESLVGD
ncbi:MAG: hypothetical protein AAF591_05365 [Verrucomicrobiota bacterium]